jgi:hypothetical protein
MSQRKSPGVVLGIIAIVIACSGSAVAGSIITGKQIKNSSITGADIKNESLSGDDLKGASIGPSELSDGVNNDISAAKARTLVPGPAGAQGPAGPAGPAGPSDLSAITVASSARVPFGPTDVVVGATAFCPAGQKVVSGGGISITDEQLAASEPNADRSGWFVIGIDLNDNGGEYVQAQALCAATGKAVAARSTTSHTAALAHVSSLVRRIAAERSAKEPTGPDASSGARLR